MKEWESCEKEVGFHVLNEAFLREVRPAWIVD